MTSNEGLERMAAWLREQISQRALTLRRIETEAGVSHQTLQKVLNAEPVARRDRLSALARALGYRGDAFELVERGDQPVTLVQEQLAQTSPKPPATIHLSASGVDLHELEEKDPEAYAAIMRQAEIALARARERRGQGR